MAIYTYRTLYQEVRRLHKDFWKTNIYGLIGTLLLLPVPIFFPLLIDEVLLAHPGKLTHYLLPLTGGAIWAMVLIVFVIVMGLRIVAFIINNKKSFYATKISQHIAYRLRVQILEHLKRVSMKEYEVLRSGAITTKTLQDIETLASFASSAVTTALSAGVMLLGITIIMISMNWMLALFILLLNPFVVLFSKILGRKVAKLLKQKHEAYQIYQEMIHETVELFVQVRASNREEHFFDRLKTYAKRIEESSISFGYQASVVRSASTLMVMGMTDIIRALGIIAVAYSDLTLGMMIAFLFYLSTLSTPIQQLMGLILHYQRTEPALERINTLLTLEREPDYPTQVNPFSQKGSLSVKMEDISFGYLVDHEILHDVSLYVSEGETIALIGKSGSGKTTLAQLLVGFYQPWKGQIYYGGTPITSIGLTCVREHVSYMLQQTLFFNDTIRMNLTLERDFSDEQIWKALQEAQLDTFVRTLPEGLDTRIGKNGIRLSGGQRQRLAIARLILSDPKVVIFDEATSALDNSTEYALYETLAPFLRGRTVIIIAHRTTTIKQADRIYVIENGHVKAEGTYESLSKKGMIVEDFDAS